MGKMRGDIDFQACLGKKSHLFMQRSSKRSSIKVLSIHFILPVLGTPQLRQQNCIPIYWQAGTSQIAPTVLLSKRNNFFSF